MLSSRKMFLFFPTSTHFCHLYHPIFLLPWEYQIACLCMCEEYHVLTQLVSANMAVYVMFNKTILNEKLCYCCAWLFVLVTFLSALTSLALLLWPLSLTRHFCLQNCSSLDAFFFFFAQFSASSRDCCVWKFQEICSFWDAQTTLSGTNDHSMVKVTVITFFPILMVDVNTKLYLHDFMHCTAATQLADLDNPINK